MSTPELWAAVAVQAEAWSATAAVDRFVRELPRNADPQRGVAKKLQEARAAAGFVGSHPLRLATNLPMALSMARSFGETTPPQPDWDDWMEAASRVETAHRVTIAWLRARMPGYPRLPVPQLAEGTALTTNEFTSRLVWTREERASGLQFVDAPTEIAETLGAPLARPISEAARQVASALAESPEWRTFAGAGAALDEAAHADLVAARSRLRHRLDPRSIDEYEPRLALRRLEYRRAVVEEELAALSGPAAAYAAAFDAADQLVELAASDVFAHLVCFPISEIEPEDLQMSPGNPPEVTFTVNDGSSLFLADWGTLTWLQDPLIDDCVQIRGISHSWDQTTASDHVAAVILTGTGEAWRRT